MYDILIQNNTSREVFIIKGLENASNDELYLQFDGVDMPEGVKDGEYTYAVIRNDRDDVVYEPNTVLLETLIKTDEGNIRLRYLSPIVGLLRVGKIEEKNVYDTNNKNKTYYYKG